MLWASLPSGYVATTGGTSKFAHRNDRKSETAGIENREKFPASIGIFLQVRVQVLSVEFDGIER